MGLDMYLTGEKYMARDFVNPDNNEKEDGFRIDSKRLELGYWRKHPNLHGFIVQTFADGVDQCQEIFLGPDKIDKIIAACRKMELPHTTGFFFGESEMTPEQMEEDVLTFEQAKAWVEDKDRPKGEFRHVVYQASW